MSLKPPVPGTSPTGVPWTDRITDLEEETLSFDAILYVDPTNGSDSNNGRGPGAGRAKATITSAQAALPATGGEIILSGGAHAISAFTYASRQALVGVGKGETDDNRGATTLTSSTNGTVISIPDGVSGWSMRDLSISGDLTKASQDLLVLGDTSHGQIERVTVQQAGRDNIVCNATTSAHFDTVYSHSAKRQNLRTTGQANALKFTKCLFRVATQYGVYIGGGTDIHFDNCTIESNSRDATTSYGGMLIDPNDADGSAFISVAMTACHFENNVGVAGAAAGVPIKVLSGTRRCAVSEIGNTYSETNPLVINYGAFRSISVFTNVDPHATIASGVLSSWIAPYNSAGATFSVTDNSAKTIIMGGDVISGRAGMKFGDVIKLERNVDGLLAVSGGKIGATSGIGYGNSLAATEVIGKAVVRKIEVFGMDGVSMGFVPVYTTIT